MTNKVQDSGSDEDIRHSQSGEDQSESQHEKEPEFIADVTFSCGCLIGGAIPAPDPLRLLAIPPLRKKAKDMDGACLLSEKKPADRKPDPSHKKNSGGTT